MKKVCLILTMILLQFGLQGQGEIDSLRSLLPTAHGEEKVDVLTSLASYLMTIDPIESSQLIDEALELSEEEGYQKGTVKGLLVKATIYSKRTDLDRADSVLHLAIQMAEAQNDQQVLADAQLTLGALRVRQGRYAEGIEHHFEGIEASRKLGNAELELSHTMNIGLIKQQIGELEEAGDYLNQALKIGEENDFRFRVGQVYLNLAVLEYRKQNLGLSIDFNKKALEIFESVGDTYTAAQALNNLGFAYNLIGQTSEAMAYYDRSIDLKRAFGDQFGVAMTLLNQAAIMRENNRPAKALELAENSIEISEELNNFQALSRGYEFLYQFHENRNEHAKALGYFKQYAAVRDSIAAHTNIAKIRALTSEFEFSRLEDDNEIQTQKILLNDLKLERRNLIILIISILFAIAVIGFLLNRRSLKNKLALSEKDKQITEQEAELSILEIQSEKEKLRYYADELLEKNKELEERRQALSEKIAYNQEEKNEIDNLIARLRASLMGEKDWATFRIYFDSVYPQYFNRLKEERQVDLTLSEQRIACLLKIKLTSKETSEILGISPDSVLKSKTRLRQKLNFDTVKAMESFLTEL